MKPCSHYLRCPIGETGWALMKILLNIAGWFLYFAQWQKSRYPCQFTLNSASCQRSLYQGASNAHPLLNDSKATSPDRGLTTPVLHTQDTLANAGNTPSFSPESVALLRKLFGSFSNFRICFGRDLSWPQLNARLNVLLGNLSESLISFCFYSPPSVFFISFLRMQ